MPALARASIVVIGDEILDGHTRDTNSGWLAERLSARGVPVDRVVTVPDTMEAIDEALATELARARPRLVLTSGGIGSTPDDLTIVAVAAHLGRGVVAEPTLDARISDWARRAEDDGAPIPDDQVAAMRKMALVPEGAYLLEGALGVTPGVAVDLEGGVREGGATIVVLPGVPEELQRIAIEGVEPLLEGLGVVPHLVELRHPYPESTLSPLLGELVERFPDVAIGSYPGRECLVRLKGERARVEEAAALVRAHLDGLAGDSGAEARRARWQARWE
ncbi:MAG: molybdopterin-binding protein [Egibacteraceae bacterium]